MSDTVRRDFLKTAAVALGVGALAQTAVAEDVAKKRKVVAINGSHRAGKTCAQALAFVIDAMKTADPTLDAELIELASLKFGIPVLGAQEPDDLDGVLAKISAPDCVGVVIASPVYFGLPSARLVALIDRLSPLRKSWALKNKILGLVAVASGRNGGQEIVLQGMTGALVAQQMILAVDGPPTSHWGATLWNQKDTILEDEFGINTAKNLGTRVAELAKRAN